jgi:hypothetical protein
MWGQQLAVQARRVQLALLRAKSAMLLHQLMMICSHLDALLQLKQPTMLICSRLSSLDACQCEYLSYGHAGILLRQL